MYSKTVIVNNKVIKELYQKAIYRLIMQENVLTKITYHLDSWNIVLDKMCLSLGFFKH